MATNWIWYVIVAVVAIGYTWWRWHRYRSRRSAFRKFAAARGWTYTEHQPDLLSRCHGDPFSGWGQRRRAWHAIAGRWNNLDVLSFEYSEVLGNQGRAHRYWQQLTGVRLPFPSHDIHVDRRRNFSRRARSLGLMHADTPDDAFDQDWLASGSFTPEMKQWVQRHRRPFRVTGGVLETWETGRFQTENMDAAVADLAELVPLVAAVRGR